MNKIKYLISRIIRTIKEQWLLFFFKVILWKLLWKNFEFIDFIFKKWNYYFRWSNIWFLMIKDSYQYMEKDDFNDKYMKFISWLDKESILNIELFIKHIKLFYHNNIVHENDLFTQREKNDYLESQNFMWKNWVLHPTWYWLFNNWEIIKWELNWAILDIWASEWAESIMFAKLIKGNKKVYSFEPSTSNYNKLIENINKSEYKNIILPQNIALWDKNELINIYWNSGVEVSTININNQSNFSEQIEMQTIDNFIEKNNIQKVDLIKWDIEWAEIESLLWWKKIITRDKPILVISIYHNWKEFFETKPLIESWNLWYKFKIIQSEPGWTWVWYILLCY